MPDELLELMQRYNQLGRLLPRGDVIDIDIALSDAETRGTLLVVLDEMATVWAPIDAFLTAHGEAPNKPPACP